MTQFKIHKGTLDFIPNNDIGYLNWAFKKGAKKQPIKIGDTVIIFNDKARKQEIMRFVMNADNCTVFVDKRGADKLPEWDRRTAAIETTYLQHSDTEEPMDSYVTVKGVKGRYGFMPCTRRYIGDEEKVAEAKAIIKLFQQKKTAIIIPAK